MISLQYVEINVKSVGPKCKTVNECTIKSMTHVQKRRSLLKVLNYNKSSHSEI